jgi:ketosteroid isomerase-like protein
VRACLLSSPAPRTLAERTQTIYLGDDLDGFMKLLDKDVVWTFMATGEKFSGIEHVRMAAERSMAGRVHTKTLHMEMTNLFWNDDELCIEYLHRCISPEHATLTGSPPAGTEMAVPICITMHVKNGKIDVFNEYLDLSTLSGGAKRTLFVQEGDGATKHPAPAAQATPPKMSNEARTVFRTLFESGKANDFETMASTLADDCEWVMMPNMQKFKGKDACAELCKKGKLASDKIPDIMTDVATSEWGVFEYMNNGTITKELIHLGTLDPSFKLTADDSAIVGKTYSVAVCFVYRLDAQGKIKQLHEYLDMEGLKKQFQPSPKA